MRIAVLREAGGLGDVVATEPVMRGLREQNPDAEIWFAGLPEYAELVSVFAAPPDAYLSVTMRERRDRDALPDVKRWPYLAAFEHFDKVINLFCPAYKYERRMRNRTDKSRVRLFCDAANVPASCPRIGVRGCDRDWARGWLAGRGCDPDKPLVGLQPVACGTRRNWLRENWAKLADELRKHGADVVAFHSFAEPLRGIGGIRAVGLPATKLAAMLDLCDLAITPDSGLLHLAAAVGTPTLSLWGSTNPDVTCEFYPLAEAIWPRHSSARPKGCKAPCYSMRGCMDLSCMKGCRILQALPVREVLARVLARLEAARARV